MADREIKFCASLDEVIERKLTMRKSNLSQILKTKRIFKEQKFSEEEEDTMMEEYDGNCGSFIETYGDFNDLRSDCSCVDGKQSKILNGKYRCYAEWFYAHSS